MNLILDVIKTDNRLLEIYEEWQDKLEKDEWYFSNSFESVTKGMTSEEAFNYLPKVIEMLFKLDEDYLIWETLYFLIELYSIADTTQIHPFLESNWSELTNHIKKFKDSYSTPFKVLKNHLRITN
ncbi:ABC transporter [Bacillus sp. FJAT-22090]|uniref:ABC transporter n=1 Tax=Bacillus sp. FJAT-22090 TaxID=1581038 RepID=UPI0021B4D448|nr:ABC transporter [Bacillus sp. FJAT-22090]